MQIKQLEYLLKIVECGSITKAASELYVSQPNLTKAIHQLEEEFDIKILSRKPRGVDLTLDGKNFVYYAKSVVSSVQALTDNCRKEHHTTHSRLFLATQQLDFVYNIFVKVFLQNNDRPVRSEQRGRQNLPVGHQSQRSGATRTGSGQLLRLCWAKIPLLPP